MLRCKLGRAFKAGIGTYTSNKDATPIMPSARKVLYTLMQYAPKQVLSFLLFSLSLVQTLDEMIGLSIGDHIMSTPSSPKENPG